MALEPQANLGGVVFGMTTSGIEAIRRTHTFKWPSIERFQNRPKKQFTGMEDEVVTIEGNYMPGVHGENVIPRIRGLGMKGNPVVLTMGDGQTFGMWCIESVSGATTAIRAKGASRKFEFTIQLSYFPG